MENQAIEITSSGAIYCRTVSAKRLLLQDRLLAYYGFENSKEMACAIFPSGLSAINTVANLFSVGAKTTFIYGNELYCDTPKIFQYQSRYNPNFECKFVDVTDIEYVLKLVEQYKDSLKLFFIESCSNPSGFIFDPSKIMEIKKICPQCIICLDNTWISGCSYNPFTFGADIVLESMSKYISAGKCIGGMMISTNNIIDRVREYSKLNGLFVSSYCCEIFLQGLDTIHKRMSDTSNLSKEVVSYISTKKEITKICYPHMQTHPSYALANQYFKYNTGCFCFCMPIKMKSMTKIKQLISQNDFLPFITSFGADHSKIDQYPRLVKRSNGKEIWIRLSIGYDSDLGTVTKGIDQIIENVYNK